jgi:hypothetical protein
MNSEKQVAIVITHTGARRALLDMDWLEMDYRVDESDWIVLSTDDWHALARGEPALWQAVERKLLIGSYLSQPDLIAVIGHPLREGLVAAAVRHDAQREHVGRIARRLHSLLLPTAVMGFWADEDGWLIDVVEPAEHRATDRSTTDVLRERAEAVARR